MSSGTLLREAKVGHPRRFAPGESDLRIEDPGPCNVDDRRSRLVDFHRVIWMYVIVREDRQPGCREARRSLLQPPC
jgi:hypothetical protein